MQRLCKAEDFHDGRCQRVSATLDTQQTRRISGRSFSLRAMDDGLSDLLLRVHPLVDHQIDTHLSFTVRFPARRVVYFCMRVAQNKSFAGRGTKFLCSIASGSRHYSHPRLSVASVERCDFNPLHHAYCTRTVSIKRIGISHTECVQTCNRHSACKAVYLCDSGGTTVDCVRVPCVRQVS